MRETARIVKKIGQGSRYACVKQPITDTWGAQTPDVSGVIPISSSGHYQGLEPLCMHERVMSSMTVPAITISYISFLFFRHIAAISEMQDLS